ncbi:MAG: methionyl-tRNA formyltransferase [Deltaproteobacteria bacterium]|nr:methionyl-tRNA formyltransferase [Deltaproteobacteria bacterium]
MGTFRIVFMGTPAFAVPALRALHDHHHRVVAVVTNPDRPKGRGRRVEAPPIKKAAEAFGYKVLQPADAKEPGMIEALTALSPDVLVVVAYGQILKKIVLDIPRLGAINVHASLLPRYRGSAPIQWAIINGDTETGVTTMWMDEGMDTGDILLSARTAIEPEETAASLHDRLAELGACLLIDTLKRLEAGTLVGTPQDHAKATYAPMLKKQDARIDWNRSAVALDAFVRGMYPWPGAFTVLDGKRLAVFRAKAVNKKTNHVPGTVLEAFPGDLDVATGDGVLSLKEVRLESGKRLSSAEFLRGHRLCAGTVLG